MDSFKEFKVDENLLLDITNNIFSFLNQHIPDQQHVVLFHVYAQFKMYLVTLHTKKKQQMFKYLLLVDKRERSSAFYQGFFFLQFFHQSNTPGKSLNFKICYLLLVLESDVTVCYL